MVISSSMSFSFLLLFIPLISAVDPALPSTIDGTFPVFDQKKCEGETGVSCIIPSTCKPIEDGKAGELRFLKNSHDFQPCIFQIIIRFYNKRKIMVEIFVDGTSVDFKNKDDQSIFICSASDDDSTSIAKSTRTNTDITMLSGKFNAAAKQLYCRFTMDSGIELFPAPNALELGEELRLILADPTKPYAITREEFKRIIKDTCDANFIVSGESMHRDGFIVSDIPFDYLFSKSITCPENSELVYEDQKNIHEATSISCDRDLTTKWYSVVNLDGTKVKKTGEFKAGCQKRECKQCSTASFQCQSPGCSLPKENDIDGCKVHQCGHSLMMINDRSDLSRGDIKCTKIEGQRSKINYEWALNGEKIEKASCPTKIPCHLVTNLTCVDDPSCSMLTGKTLSSVDCKERRIMMVITKGVATPVRNLVCDLTTGHYKQTLEGAETDLPDDARIKCEDSIVATTALVAPMAGSLGMYVGCGLAVVAAIAAIAVVIFCCISKRRDAKLQLPTTNGTMAKKDSTTKRSSETKSKPTTPETAQSVSIAPPTPIVRTTPAASTTTWGDFTERTPNAPTPLDEQRTQTVQSTHRTKSEKSGGPVIPLPKIEEAPPSNPEQSKSGVESTKRKKDSDGDTGASKKIAVESNHHGKKKSSHHSKSRDVNATQREESTKRTQNETSTKRTQNTQNTQQTHSMDDGGGGGDGGARIPVRMPPKRAEYVAVSGLGAKDSLDESDESASNVPPRKQKPLTASTQTHGTAESPYLKLADFNGETPPNELKQSTDYKNLVTQKSEEDISKMKTK